MCCARGLGLCVCSCVCCLVCLAGLVVYEWVHFYTYSEFVKIVDVEDVPLAYLPGNATRVRVKAVGDLDDTS